MLLHDDIMWIQHVLRKSIQSDVLSDDEKQHVAPLLDQLHYATYEGWIISEIEEWLDRHDLPLPDQTTMDGWVRRVQERYSGAEIENCISPDNALNETSRSAHHSHYAMFNFKPTSSCRRRLLPLYSDRSQKVISIHSL